MSERLHPESMRQLRMLVKLHGAFAIENALWRIKQDNLQAVVDALKEK